MKLKDFKKLKPIPKEYLEDKRPLTEEEKESMFYAP